MNTRIIPLPERGILEIQGPDSQKFLQGQCTSDVMNLRPGQATLGGFCTPKGRLYANFYLLCLTDSHYWLIMPIAQVPTTLMRLAKYAAFFKTTLHDASLQWHCLATLDEDLAAAQTWPATLVATNDQVILNLNDHATLRWLNVLSESRYEDQLAQWELSNSFLDESVWAQQEIAWGLVWITPNTAEEYIPQVIAWDHIGGVSFTKGCYTGQEVVARLHYKGASKKLLRRISGTGVVPAPLTPITDDAGKTLGHVASTATTNAHWIGLAVMSTASQPASQAVVNEVVITLHAWVNYQPAIQED